MNHKWSTRNNLHRYISTPIGSDGHPKIQWHTRKNKIVSVFKYVSISFFFYLFYVHFVFIYLGCWICVSVFMVIVCLTPFLLFVFFCHLILVLYYFWFCVWSSRTSDLMFFSVTPAANFKMCLVSRYFMFVLYNSAFVFVCVINLDCSFCFAFVLHRFQLGFAKIRFYVFLCDLTLDFVLQTVCLYCNFGKSNTSSRTNQ